MKKLRLILVFTFLVSELCMFGQVPEDSIYFGFTPPGDSAIVFAPGVISIPGRMERTPNYLPDYTEFYFTLTVGGAKAYSTKYTDKWEIPEVDSSFRSNVSDFSISDNGTFTCFTSWEGTYNGQNTDIWMVERQDSGWSEPEKLPDPINSNIQEWGACILENRNVYVCKRYGTSPNYHANIVKYEYNSGNYNAVYFPEINTDFHEWDPFVPDDESYIIFKSNRNSTDMDLYIAYKKSDGTFTTPINLGNKINSPLWEDCGNVTPDGKYFMFARSEKDNSLKDIWRDIYWVSSNFIEELKPDELKLYLGQSPPGNAPEVFAPGILSKAGRKERTLTFTPDGKEIYFSVINAGNDYTIKLYELVDGVWQEEKTAQFVTQYLSNYSCLEPFISPYGSKMLFCAKLKSQSGWDYDLYLTEREGENWGQPVKLESSINTSSGEWHPCITSSGNIYFARDDANIYMSVYSESGYENAVKLSTVNTTSPEWDPYVDPAETFMIFKSERSGGFGAMDNYVSFRDTLTGEWSEPVNPGSVINSSWGDDAGDVTSDGKYFFYSRTNDAGEMDVYWVKADFIEDFKPGISENIGANNLFNFISVYPNPANEIITIELKESGTKKIKYELYNLTGKVLFKGNTESSVQIDISSIYSGIYFIHLHFDEKVICKNIVINPR